MPYSEHTDLNDGEITQFGMEDACEVAPVEYWELPDFADLIALAA